MKKVILPAITQGLVDNLPKHLADIAIQILKSNTAMQTTLFVENAKIASVFADNIKEIIIAALKYGNEQDDAIIKLEEKIIEKINQSDPYSPEFIKYLNKLETSRNLNKTVKITGISLCGFAIIICGTTVLIFSKGKYTADIINQFTKANAVKELLKLIDNEKDSLRIIGEIKKILK